MNAGSEYIFTISYEKSDISNFLNRLQESHVKILCDVRFNPNSRKKGFSKKALVNSLKESGISYENFRELGISSNDRKTKSTKELFYEYQQRLDRESTLVGPILKLIQKKQTIALCCFELDINLCHRKVLAEHIQNKLNMKNIEIKHL